MPDPRTWIRLAQARNKKEAAAINEATALLDIQEEYQPQSQEQQMAAQMNQMEPGYISQQPPKQ